MDSFDGSRGGSRELLLVIFRRKWTVLGAFCAALTATFLFTLLTSPIYEAKAKVMVQPERGSSGIEGVLETQSYLQTGTFNVSVINNQVEILKSWTIAERVIERLQSSPYANRLSLLSAKKGNLTRSHVIQKFRQSVNVIPLREADIIEVRVKAPSAWEAQILANTLASAYVDENLSVVRGEVKEVKSFLQDQISVVRDRLAKSEENLRAFKEKEKVVSLPEEISSMVTQVAYFEGLYNQATTDLATTQTRLDHLKELLEKQTGTLVEDVAEVSTPVISEMRKELADLESIRARYLAQGYGETHQKMAEIDNRIRETKSRLVESTKKLVSAQLSGADPLAFSQELVDKIVSLETEVVTANARAEALRNIIAYYESQLEKLPAKTLELARLERSAKVDENVLMMLMQKYEEARIREAGQIGNVRVIDPAREPDSPVRPRKKLNLAVGGILGLMLGIGLAYFRNYLPDTIESTEAIERISSSPVLGTIPEIKSVRSRLQARRSPKGEKLQGANAALPERTRLITQIETWSPISEAYRTLRTNIQFTGIDSPVKTILISSPGPSEGKSTTVANLAITMAQAGAKTLVVDSDLRKPIVDSLLNSKNTIGLTNLLRAECTLDEAIAVTDIPNLSVLGSGPLPPNPSEMLGSNRMKSLIAALRERFDYILLDSPPVVTVTDAALLAATADATLLVVRSGVSSREGLARAISLLGNVRARFVGTVFNAVDIGLGYGHYFDYYRYYRSPGDSRS